MRRPAKRRRWGGGDAPTHGYLRPAGLVDPVHVLAELGAVAVPVPVVLRHEQKRVDHLVKERL